MKLQVFFNFTECFGHKCTSSPSFCFMVYFVVDGGHRAIIFSRIGGIQDNIYTEGLHFRCSNALLHLFTYSCNKNITYICMYDACLYIRDVYQTVAFSVSLAVTPPPPHPLTLPAYYNKLTQCPRYNMEAA